MDILRFISGPTIVLGVSTRNYISSSIYVYMSPCLITEYNISKSAVQHHTLAMISSISTMQPIALVPSHLKGWPWICKVIDSHDLTAQLICTTTEHASSGSYYARFLPKKNLPSVRRPLMSCTYTLTMMFEKYKETTHSVLAHIHSCNHCLHSPAQTHAQPLAFKLLLDLAPPSAHQLHACTHTPSHILMFAQDASAKPDFRLWHLWTLCSPAQTRQSVQL